MGNESKRGPEGAAGPTEAVESLLQAILPHAEDGSWDEVAERLRSALDDYPGDPYLLCWIGLAERELGLDGVAYERFKQVLGSEPQDPVLLATVGNAIAAFDDPEAETALRTAVMIAPELPQARWMYGAFLAREGMPEDAIKHLEAAIELSPEDAVIWLEGGVARALTDDLEGAAHAFARSIELDAGDGWGLILLGLTELLNGDVEMAMRELEEGARMRPEDLEAQLLAALSLAACGWEDRALEMLERARLRAEGVDEDLVSVAELQIEDGTAASLQFLTETLGPSSFRERLMQRP